MDILGIEWSPFLPQVADENTPRLMDTSGGVLLENIYMGNHNNQG
jgi:hypothetical protein